LKCEGTDNKNETAYLNQSNQMSVQRKSAREVAQGKNIEHLSLIKERRNPNEK